VLLLSYPVQPESSPYKGISPIFVREAAEAQYVVTMKSERRLHRDLCRSAPSTRAITRCGRRNTRRELGELAERLFQNHEISYLHVHHARRGCYVGRMDRA
jgi:hypothetical protein